MITSETFIKQLISKLNKFFPEKNFEIKIEKEGKTSYIRLYENNIPIRDVDLNGIPEHDIVITNGYNMLLEEIIKDSILILNENTSLLPSTTVGTSPSITSGMLEVLTPPQNFGDVNIGYHRDQVILIQNTSDEDLEVDKIKITRKDYTLHNPPELPIYIEGNDYLAITVRFRPLKSGLRNAKLTIGEQTIKLTGKGV